MADALHFVSAARKAAASAVISESAATYITVAAIRAASASVGAPMIDVDGPARAAAAVWEADGIDVSRSCAEFHHDLSRVLIARTIRESPAAASWDTANTVRLLRTVAQVVATVPTDIGGDGVDRRRRRHLRSANTMGICEPDAVHDAVESPSCETHVPGDDSTPPDAASERALSSQTPRPPPPPLGPTPVTASEALSSSPTPPPPSPSALPFPIAYAIPTTTGAIPSGDLAVLRDAMFAASLVAVGALPAATEVDILTFAIALVSAIRSRPAIALPTCSVQTAMRGSAGAVGGRSGMGGRAAVRFAGALSVSWAPDEAGSEDPFKWWGRRGDASGAAAAAAAPLRVVPRRRPHVVRVTDATEVGDAPEPDALRAVVTVDSSLTVFADGVAAGCIHCGALASLFDAVAGMRRDAVLGNSSHAHARRVGAGGDAEGTEDASHQRGDDSGDSIGVLVALTAATAMCPRAAAYVFGDLGDSVVCTESSTQSTRTATVGPPLGSPAFSSLMQLAAGEQAQMTVSAKPGGDGTASADAPSRYRENSSKLRRLASVALGTRLTGAIVEGVATSVAIAMQAADAAHMRNSNGPVGVGRWKRLGAYERRGVAVDALLAAITAAASESRLLHAIAAAGTLSSIGASVPSSIWTTMVSLVAARVGQAAVRGSLAPAPSSGSFVVTAVEAACPVAVRFPMTSWMAAPHLVPRYTAKDFALASAAAPARLCAWPLSADSRIAPIRRFVERSVSIEAFASLPDSVRRRALMVLPKLRSDLVLNQRSDTPVVLTIMNVVREMVPPSSIPPPPPLLNYANHEDTIWSAVRAALEDISPPYTLTTRLTHALMRLPVGTRAPDAPLSRRLVLACRRGLWTGADALAAWMAITRLPEWPGRGDVAEALDGPVAAVFRSALIDRVDPFWDDTWGIGADTEQGPRVGAEILAAISEEVAVRDGAAPPSRTPGAHSHNESSAATGAVADEADSAATTADADGGLPPDTAPLAGGRPPRSCPRISLFMLRRVLNDISSLRIPARETLDVGIDILLQACSEVVIMADTVPPPSGLVPMLFDLKGRASTGMGALSDVADRSLLTALPSPAAVEAQRRADGRLPRHHLFVGTAPFFIAPIVSAILRILTAVGPIRAPSKAAALLVQLSDAQFMSAVVSEAPTRYVGWMTSSIHYASSAHVPLRLLLLRRLRLTAPTAPTVPLVEATAEALRLFAMAPMVSARRDLETICSHLAKALVQPPDSPGWRHNVGDLVTTRAPPGAAIGGFPPSDVTPRMVRGLTVMVQWLSKLRGSSPVRALFAYTATVHAHHSSRTPLELQLLAVQSFNDASIYHSQLFGTTLTAIPKGVSTLSPAHMLRAVNLLCLTTPSSLSMPSRSRIEADHPGLMREAVMAIVSHATALQGLAGDHSEAGMYLQQVIQIGSEYLERGGSPSVPEVLHDEFFFRRILGHPMHPHCLATVYCTNHMSMYFHCLSQNGG